jgi:arylsulfatase A-like enzyme
MNGLKEVHITELNKIIKYIMEGNLLLRLKYIICFILICCIGIIKTQAQEKPNVVLINADDLGYGDLGCYGATKVKTPNIDKLARQGKIFTDAHSASAVCTPSRYGLLTGQYPVRGNDGKGIWGPAGITQELLIKPNQTTIADVFKNSGYATAALGKWHLGFKTGINNWQQPLSPGPNDLGFDYYYGVPLVNSAPPYVYVENTHVAGGDSKDPLVYVGKEKNKNITPITPIPPEASQRTSNRFTGAIAAHKLYNDYTVGQVLTEKAVSWITEKTTQEKETPFFLYMATTHIHHPFTPGKNFQGKSDADLYGDFIQELDWMVGEVTSTLEKQGVAENTLIIFTSDNGAMLNLGGRNAVKAGHKINGDLLGFKFGVWEGGHRIPFIAKWPNKIKKGTVSNQLICNVDMLATFMAITEQNLNSLENSDSVNVLNALLENPKENIRKELLLAPRSEKHLSLRKGKWIYIPAKGSGGFKGSKPQHHAWGGAAAVNFVGGKNSEMAHGKIKEDAQVAQLYNLEDDKYQTTNVYNQYPEIVKEMQATLDTYQPKK